MFLTMTPIRKLSNLDVKPINGKNGKDAPSLEDILARIPTPENGKDGKAGIDGLCGDPGKEGKQGEKGKDGINGKDAPDLKTILEKVKPLLPSAASNGLDGSDGEDGFTPDHELDQKKLRIRFTKPDGTWGDWLEIGKELSKLIARQIGAYSYRGGGSSGSSEDITFSFTSTTEVLSSRYIEQTAAGITTTISKIPTKGNLISIMNKSTGTNIVSGGSYNIEDLGTQNILKDETFSLVGNGTQWRLI